MLNQDKLKIFLLLFIVLFFINSCQNHEDKRNRYVKEQESKIFNKSTEILGEDEYYRIYNLMTDSIQSWIDENFLIDSVYRESEKKYFVTIYTIDSIFCVNSEKNKIVGSLILYDIADFDLGADGYEEFLGAKVDNEWYFWRSAYHVICRKPNCEHTNKNLTYHDIHKFVIESYGGYLDKNGNVNEKWFDNFFKGPGWGKFEDRYLSPKTLDGNIIDNEEDYYNFLWKRKGLGRWNIRKKELQKKAEKDSLDLILNEDL